MQRSEEAMRTKVTWAVMAAMLATPVGAATTYHGKKHVYHSQRCKRSKGTTGAILGGAGGAVAGGAIIGGPVAVVGGAVGGALLGKHIDKKENRKRNRRRGC
jgi:membrane associated rhomboid family serine protease